MFLKFLLGFVQPRTAPPPPISSLHAALAFLRRRAFRLHCVGRKYRTAKTEVRHPVKNPPPSPFPSQTLSPFGSHLSRPCLCKSVLSLPCPRGKINDKCKSSLQPEFSCVLNLWSSYRERFVMIETLMQSRTTASLTASFRHRLFHLGTYSVSPLSSSFLLSGSFSSSFLFSCPG